MTSEKNLKLGSFGKQGQFDIENQQIAKGGVRREEVSQELQTIFDAFDTDGNKVLTQSEISSMKASVESYAKHGKDSIFSNKEAEKMIEENSIMKNANSTAESVFKFLQEVELKLKNSNVIKSVVDKDGNAAITIAQGNKSITKTYDKETGTDVLETVTVNNDANGIAATEVVEKEGLRETYTYINGQKLLTERIENQGKENETITTISYDSDGNKSKEKITEKEKITQNEYKDNILFKQTISSVNTEEIKELVSGHLLTTKKIENKNDSETKKEIIIQYNNNGRIETITDKTGTTVIKQIGANRTITTKNGITTDLEKTQSGYSEIITNDKNSNKTENILDQNKQKLSQTKTVNGKEYSIQYDGKGNTVGMVVQYGENAAIIAKKFGCTKDALLKANGKQPGQDFQTGEIFIIPKEIEADDKNLKRRKDQAGALRDKAIADERARQIQLQKEQAKQRAIAQDKAYRAAGLKNYKHQGETFIYNKQKYTVIGTMNNRERIMVRDSKGNIHIASHDNIVLNDVFVQQTTLYDKGKKVTLKNGQEVVVMRERGDRHGRMIALDKNGNTVVVSGGSKANLSDRVVLNNSWVSASDQNDIINDQIKNAKTEEEKNIIINQHRAISSDKYVRCRGNDGKVWYIDRNTGKPVNLSRQEAAAVTKEIDAATTNRVLGTGWGTDEAGLVNANNMIMDPAVLAEVNKTYEARGYKANKEYRSAYEAFLGTEITRSEVYELNADLVNNNAILKQERRNEILYTNVAIYGDNQANLNKGLNAIGTRKDYDNLQNNLAQYNSQKGYQAHFQKQDPLQTTIYNNTGGDANRIASANRALIDPNETFLTNDEVIRIQAEVGAYYLEQGDSQNATRSQDANVLAVMDNLELLDGSKIDVNIAEKTDLMIAGYGEYTNEEIANEAIHYLTMAVKSYEQVEVDFSNQYMDAQFGHHGSSSTHQSAEDYAAKAFQLIRNYEVLQLVKKRLGSEYDEYIAKINHETKGDVDFSKLQLGVSTQSDLSQEVIDENLATLAGLRVAVSDLEKAHLDDVDAEGWKLDFVNDIRQTLFLGSTRADVENQYAMTKSTISKLELAAKGQLVDADGNLIKFEDAVKQFTGKTIQELQSLNQQYQTHQQYGELGLDITAGLVTMVIPGAQEYAVGTILNIGNSIFKVTSVVNKASMTYRLAKVAYSSLEAGAKITTVQYAMDRTNLATSTSGNSLENRGMIETKAGEAGAYAATGTAIGGVTGIITEGLTSTTGRVAANVTGYGVDLTASAAISTGMHGGNLTDYLTPFNEDGTINTANMMNLAMTSFGYIGGLKGAQPKSEAAVSKPKIELTENEQAIWNRLSKQNAQRSVGTLSDANFSDFRSAYEKKLKAASTEAEVQELRQFNERLHNRKQRRELDNLAKSRLSKMQKSHPIQDNNDKVNESVVEEKQINTEKEVSPENVVSDTHSVNESQIPQHLKSLWKDCQEKIEQIAKELSSINIVNPSGLLSRGRSVLSQLKTIIGSISDFSLKSKLQKISDNLKALLNKKLGLNEGFRPVTSEEEALKVYNNLIENRAVNYKNTKTLEYTTDGQSYLLPVEGWRYEIYESSGTGNITTDYNNQKAKIGSQWKMHIYANSAEEWANVAQIALPYLRDNEIIYKTMMSIDEEAFNSLRAAVNNEGIYSQTGKAFTLYFKNEEEFLQVAKGLETRFKESGLKSSGTVMNEAQIGESGFLSYRHEGAERGTKYKPDNVEDPYLKNGNDKIDLNSWNMKNKYNFSSQNLNLLRDYISTPEMAQNAEKIINSFMHSGRDILSPEQLAISTREIMTLIKNNPGIPKDLILGLVNNKSLNITIRNGEVIQNSFSDVIEYASAHPKYKKEILEYIKDNDCYVKKLSDSDIEFGDVYEQNNLYQYLSDPKFSQIADIAEFEHAITGLREGIDTIGYSKYENLNRILFGNEPIELTNLKTEFYQRTSANLHIDNNIPIEEARSYVEKIYESYKQIEQAGQYIPTDIYVTNLAARGSGGSFTKTNNEDTYKLNVRPDNDLDWFYHSVNHESVHMIDRNVITMGVDGGFRFDRNVGMRLDNTFDSSIKDYAGKYVSKYSQTMIHEFVAEYGSMMLEGKIYIEEITTDSGEIKMITHIKEPFVNNDGVEIISLTPEDKANIEKLTDYYFDVGGLNLSPKF